jgi:hypothetical protein
LDAACVIYRSDKPLAEKLVAYQMLIDEFPDMPVHKNMDWDRHESMHEYLRGLILYETNAEKVLKTAESGVIYQGEVSLANDPYYGTYPTAPHSEYQLTLDELLKDWSENEYRKGLRSCDRLIVKKIAIDGDRPAIASARHDIKGNIIDIYLYSPKDDDDEGDN